MNTDRKLIQPIAGLALATALLLLIPLAAMQFTGKVVWTLSDFIVAGSLLFGTGFTYILVTRILAPQMRDNIVYRIGLVVSACGTRANTSERRSEGVIHAFSDPVLILFPSLLSLVAKSSKKPLILIPHYELD